MDGRDKKTAIQTELPAKKDAAELRAYISLLKAEAARNGGAETAAQASAPAPASPPNQKSTAKKRESYPEWKPRRKKRHVMRTAEFILLSIAVLILLWAAAGILISIFTSAESVPLGYRWFNSAIYPLF